MSILRDKQGKTSPPPTPPPIWRERERGLYSLMSAYLLMKSNDAVTFLGTTMLGVTFSTITGSIYLLTAFLVWCQKRKLKFCVANS